MRKMWDPINYMKRLRTLFLAAGLMLIVGLGSSATVSATHTQCDDGRPIPHTNARQAEAFCSGRISDAEQAAADASKAQANTTCDAVNVSADSCPIFTRYVIPAINALSAAVGVVIISMIVWGGIKYSSSRDNPQQAAQAKDHIRNALLALLIYVFFVAFLNWVVPGGVF
jgi:hypothetical protein